MSEDKYALIGFNLEHVKNSIDCDLCQERLEELIERIKAAYENQPDLPVVNRIIDRIKRFLRGT